MTQIICCLGLYRSGSTWAFNVVLQALRVSMPRKQVGFCFADELETVPWHIIHKYDIFVIRGHAFDPRLIGCLRIIRPLTVITIRDPRDAAASWIERFGVAFDEIEHDFLASMTAIINCSEFSQSLLLRYEDAVIGSANTIQAIADLIDGSLSAAEIAQIKHNLSTDSVKTKITQLLATSKISDSDLRSFDLETHWGPRHIGDGKLFKYRDILKTDDILRLEHTGRTFCRMFHYLDTKPPLPIPSGVQIDLTDPNALPYLGQGWSYWERTHVWSVGDVASLILPLSGGPTSEVIEVELSAGSIHFAGRGGTEFEIIVNKLPVFVASARSGDPATYVFKVTEDALHGNILDVLFKFLNPTHAPSGADERLLGISLRSVLIKY